MATVFFTEDFTKNEERILRKCAKTHTKSLGIHERDFAATIRKVKLPKRSIIGSMAQLENGQFLILLNSDGFNLFDASSALGHELVHIRQYLDGDIKDHRNHVTWKGTKIPRFICDSGMFYNDLPWEVEAFDLQPSLHQKALENLETREQFTVAASKLHAD
jgi:hypothetical protein